MKATIENLVLGILSEKTYPMGLQATETLNPKNGVQKRFTFLIALILSVIFLSPENSFSQTPPGDNTRSGGLELKANDGNSYDYFGQSVAINNDWVIVGAYNDKINGMDGAGSAYVFHPGASWPQHTKLTSCYIYAGAGDHFGWSVSVSDNYAVVGAPWSTTYGVSSGVACIFRLSDMTQTEVIDMGPYYAEEGDEFGASVAMDIITASEGDNVIVGAPGHSGGGMACVYYRDFMLESWSLQTRLTAGDLAAGDRFGCSVDLYLEYYGGHEDENFIVGAKNHDIGTEMAAGAAYIYHHDLTLYQRVEVKLTAPDYQAEDYFGCAVSIHDNYAIVGAQGDDTHGDFSGAAYIFEREDIYDTTWAFVVKLTAGEYAQAGALFGASVSISDDYAIVGAPNDDVSATNSGAAYLFYRSGNTWSSTPTRVSEPANSDIRLGNSVAGDSDEDNFVVGAYQADPNGTTNAGAAYIYSSTRGGISGNISVNGSGTPVSGAIISIGAWSDTSDLSGNYAIDNIIEGTFDVSCVAPGYAESIATDVVITGGSVTNQNFSLNPIAEEAIAIWHFDEGQGTTAFDATNNDNDGTITGATWATGCDGPFGLLFDGNDKVTVPHSNSLDITQPFSVEAMIKCTGQSYYYAIVDKYTHHQASGIAEGFTLYLSGGKLRFSMYCGSNGNIGAAGTTNLWDSDCHHVKASWDGDTIRMFVDGNMEGKAAWAHPPASTTANLGIGMRLSGWGGYMSFQGIIDEVIISNVSEEPGQFDFGDAPDPSFPTLLANNGARHLIDGITYLGLSVDDEADGMADPQALGDDNTNLADEDGVTFLWPISAGNPCKIAVNASVDDAFLNAWIDFNGDGDWDDPGDQIFSDEPLLIAGDNFLNFIVPKDAVPGASFARFRFSHQSTYSYDGQAYDGEVEDYMVEIDDYGSIKWRQLPDTSLAGLHATLPMLNADDWLCNGGVVTDVHWWGNYENNFTGQGIDHFIINFHNDNGCFPADPEFLSFVVPLNTIQEINTGMLNKHGDTIYYYEYFLPEPFSQVEGTRYWLSIAAVCPDNSVQWRWQEAGRMVNPILCSAVSKGTGTWTPIIWQTPLPPKFTDMAFIITSTEPPDLDFGDAPDEPYPTLLANNGARHMIDDITYLGASVDVEPNGIADPMALGDDNNNLADEDGVVLTSVLSPGKQVCLEVTASVGGMLNAWMDFNIDGDWDDAGEQIFVDENLTAGINPLSLAVPANALAGNTFARFRFNTLGGLSYEGYASDGEVEDYQLEIVGDVDSWTDGFEAYAIDSDIVGQGGWEMWGALSSSPTARVVGNMSYSGNQSLKIRGKADQSGDDIVHQFRGCSSGVWELSAQQYIPSNTSGGITYFILLNQYACDGSTYNWSTQLGFNPDLNIVKSDGEDSTLSLIKNEWIKISIVINLDNNTQSIYYNGQLLVSKSWTEGLSGGGNLNIAALNLFSGTLQNADVFYDDISLKPLTTQDLTIFEGWSGISAALNPVPQTAQSILSPIDDKLVMMRNLSSIYWPGQTINTIGNWDHTSGYIIKVNEDVSLEITGSELPSYTLYLNQGWNLIPVYSEVDAMATLGSLPGFIMAKGIATTEILWPGFGIYNLTKLYPGKSYLVYMSQPASFTYPAGNNKSTDIIAHTQTFATPWNDVHKSPSTHVVAFPQTSIKLFNPGDVIGAFTQDGVCVDISVMLTPQIGDIDPLWFWVSMNVVG